MWKNYKFHKIFLGCVHSRFIRMFRCVAFTVLLLGDYFKRLIIPEYGKDDVADLMHDGSDGYIFLFAFAFISVLVINDRVYWCFRPFIHFEVIKRHHMQDAPGKA